jgi:chorismate lyase/3-hydroxybenzoate synthase
MLTPDGTMVQGCEILLRDQIAAPRVGYSASPRLDASVLAAFGFTLAPASHADPRWTDVALAPIGPSVHEYWTVDGAVASGRDGDIRFARGGGWLFAAMDIDERAHGGPAGAARHAYDRLTRFLAGQPERHVQRLWNYLGGINAGDGDEERYKLFCQGRAQGMGTFFGEGFPAATAIGHHAGEHLLQVYLLAGPQPGRRVENPRQVSAWQYPRQYGATAPTFSRATMLASGDALAISGTASVVGHVSTHAGNLAAQLEETLLNLDAVLESGDMPAGFDAHSPLKVYIRHPGDAPFVRDALAARLPDAPLLLLHGDVCRADLLLEIDGWRFSP